MKKISITPRGNRVIIEQTKLETTTESGIVLKLDNEMAEQASVIKGKVLALGDACWDSWPTPWAEVGDIVYYAKFAGKQIPDPVTEEVYLIMMDEDIIATLEEETKDD
jgi:co-chaperonin GroES (HSP10)